MSQHPAVLPVQQRPDIFIGREKELQEIRKLLEDHQQTDRTLVIAIRAQGGLGKTRLLEEVLMRLGHPYVHERLGLQQAPVKEPWSFEKPRYLPSDILDFAWPELSVRSNFLEAMRKSFSWAQARGQLTFYEHERRLRDWQRALVGQYDVKQLQQLLSQVEEGFWRDLKAFKKEGIRLVWALDTVERLAVPLDSPIWGIWGSSPEERRKPLVTEEEALFITTFWLLHHLKQGSFGPAVLILAGRENEGEPFWNQLEQAAQKSGNFILKTITLSAFTPGETKRFLQRISNALPEQSPAKEHLQSLLQDEKSLAVLHRLTGGEPVRLAMYTDVLLTSDSIPIPLRKLAHQQIPDEEKERYQHVLEARFLDLLFRRAHEGDLASKILLALTRSPRGLSPCQVHFLLDAADDRKLKQWRPDPQRLEEIEATFHQLRRLTLLKIRQMFGEEFPNGHGNGFNGHGCPKEKTQWRLTLQDEVYRIVAQHLGQRRDDEEFQIEKEVRQRQYEKLQRWAEYKREAYHRQQHALFQKELAGWRMETPEQALRLRWPSLTIAEEKERWFIAQQMQFWEAEALHYYILRDPVAAWNSHYLDLGESRWYANHLEAELLLQHEVYFLIAQWSNLLRFAIWPERYAGNFTEKITRLQRAVRTEATVRWVKRFIGQREVKRAQQLALNIEEAIKKLVKPNRDEQQVDREAQRAWLHPLSWGERRIWHWYADILAGDVDTAKLEQFETLMADLERLWQTPPNQDVRLSGDLEGTPGWENVLKTVKGVRGMPMAPRLQRILAIGYNFLGYGYVVVGKFVQGAKFYRKSLYYMRDIKFPAQKAATLNNLGRALTDSGRPHEGLMLVYQALALREDLAAAVPYAYSLNTAALINNKLGRPLRALGQAARAAAMFRQAQEPRGLGLALVQVALAARRLAKSPDPGLLLMLRGEPQALLRMAEEAAREASDIFDPRHCDDTSQGQAAFTTVMGVCEPLRWIEALRVLGEIYQDQMRDNHTPMDLQRLYEKSLGVFHQALEEAEGRGWQTLAAATRVDIIETHYWYAYYLRRWLAPKRDDKTAQFTRSRGRLRQAIQDGLKLIEEVVEKQVVPREAVIAEKEEAQRRLEERQKLDQDGHPTFKPPKRKPEHTPYWNLLAKRYRFESGLWLERAWLDWLQKERTTNEEALDIASRSLVKAVLYGRLFGPQSRSIRMAFRFAERYFREWLDPKQGETDEATKRWAKENAHKFFAYIQGWWDIYRRSDNLKNLIDKIKECHFQVADCDKICQGISEEWRAFQGIAADDHSDLPRWLHDVYFPEETNGNGSNAVRHHASPGGTP